MMLHPSYSDLIKAVNKDVEMGETPVVNSRYSIVLATAKRAREIVAGEEPLLERADRNKPLSAAIEELYEGRIKIAGEDEEPEDAPGKADEEPENAPEEPEA